jgi:hypothetical protein
MVGGRRHAPAALPPEKYRYQWYRRLGGPQGWSREMRKITSPTGIRSPDRLARSVLVGVGIEIFNIIYVNLKLRIFQSNVFLVW